MLALHEVEGALTLARQQLAAGDGLLCQSICLDVLVLVPEHGDARTLLVEALAEGAGSLSVTEGSAEAFLVTVADPQERSRLEGILAYRRALSMLRQSVPVFVVRDWLHRARASFRAAGAERVDVRLRLAAIDRLVAQNPDLA